MDVHALAAAFGVPGVAEHLYRQVRPGSGQALEQVAASLLLAPDDLLQRLQPLVQRGIVRVEDGVLVVLSPAEALQSSLARQAAMLGRMGEELVGLQRALPGFIESVEADENTEEGRIKGDVARTDNAMRQVLDWMQASTGEICFMRPDQWKLPSESEMAVAVANAIRQGRRVRALYPARVLREAPALLEKRAQIGEEIRLVPELITRMMIIGPGRAVVPEPLGLASELRVAVRQPALVRLVQAYFDLVWDSAVPATGFERMHVADERRRLLLRQLAQGAKDEQIARTLDLSLRTVRREVARLMEELGADSRFQAGAEAVRRGWL